MMSVVSPPAQRRRVLYIRHARTELLSEAFRLNQDEWVETLSTLADVILVETSFDLEVLGASVKPDFIVYESPVNHAQTLTIGNPRAHPEIPRYGFFMQDPISPVAVHFMRQVHDLGIGQIFSHLPEACMRQMPELRRMLLPVHLLFDASVFRDYALPKDIPISIFGGFMLPEIYQWRAQNGRAIMNHFPTLLYAHPGYKHPVARHAFAVTGEAYARLLNRSYFSLADTTILDYPVRKHLEIPACGSVLISPDAPSLRPYGFVDMENCVMGDGSTLVEKIAAVIDNPSHYDSIRRNGHDLVHGQYTRQHWTGVLDHFEQRHEPHSPPALSLVDSAVSLFFKKWEQAITQEAAPPDFPSWVHHIDNNFLMIGIMMLIKGDIQHARDLLLVPQKLRVEKCGFADYDPEEIAWLSLIGALTADQNLQALTRTQASHMDHLSLRRMKWLGSIMAGHGTPAHPPVDSVGHKPNDLLSVHFTGQWPLAIWLDVIKKIFVVYGQKDLVTW